MGNTVRIAAFQRKPIFDDISLTASQIIADAKWCDDHDVVLAVFPECYLQGYATTVEIIQKRAISLEDLRLRRLIHDLSSYRTTFVIGFIERRLERFFNSAMVISQGKVMGVYSKAHPNEKGFDAGTGFPTFALPECSFGVNICNDANFPETALRLAKQGAEVICYPLNNLLEPAVAEKWRERSVENLKRRARETKCWIVSADVVGEYNHQKGFGCTLIVNPSGEIVARVAEETEGAAYFDIDLNASSGK